MDSFSYPKCNVKNWKRQRQAEQGRAYCRYCVVVGVGAVGAVADAGAGTAAGTSAAAGAGAVAGAGAATGVSVVAGAGAAAVSAAGADSATGAGAAAFLAGLQNLEDALSKASADKSGGPLCS